LIFALRRYRHAGVNIPKSFFYVNMT